MLNFLKGGRPENPAFIEGWLNSALIERSGNSYVMAGEGHIQGGSVAMQKVVGGYNVRAGMKNSTAHKPQDAIFVGELKPKVLRIAICDGITGLDKKSGQLKGTNSGIYSRDLARALADKQRPISNLVRLFRAHNAPTANDGLDQIYNDTTIQAADITQNEKGAQVTLYTCGGPDTGYTLILLPDGKLLKGEVSEKRSKVFSEGQIAEITYQVPFGSRVILTSDAFRKTPEHEVNSLLSIGDSVDDFVRYLQNISSDDTSAVIIEI